MFFVGMISPVDTENKRLDKQLRDNCKKKIWIILGVEVVCVSAFFVFSRVEFLQAAVMALIIESILLGVGKLVNKKGEDKYVNCDL